MSPLELGTFAAVFDAAMALEAHLQRRYDTQSSQPDPAGAVFRALAKDGEKRLRRLERVRRETVTEMILIPITGLAMSDDLSSLGDVDPAAPLTLETAQALEESAARFYEEAAEKIGLDEAARALRRMAKGSRKRAGQLQDARAG